MEGGGLLAGPLGVPFSCVVAFPCFPSSWSVLLSPRWLFSLVAALSRLLFSCLALAGDAAFGLLVLSPPLQFPQELLGGGFTDGGLQEKQKGGKAHVLRIPTHTCL